MCRVRRQGGLGEPDLVIRTSGELRLSNFLLWESAYAELYFTDCLWPDFDEAALHKARPAQPRAERRAARGAVRLLSYHMATSRAHSRASRAAGADRVRDAAAAVRTALAD